MVVFKVFYFLFMSLLTAPVIENNYILNRVYYFGMDFIFLKKDLGANMKLFRYRI